MINSVTFPNLGISLTLNRVAVNIFGFPIYWYAVIMATGIILAYIYAVYEGKKQNINGDVFSDLLIIGIPSAVIAARIYYVATRWDYYSQNVGEIFNLRAGGIAIYGAIIGSVTALLIYCKIKKQKPLQLLDICSVGLLIGQAIGRWGNFVNVEAYGYQTDTFFKMGIYSDELNKVIYVHPTFLYESVWNFAGVILLSLFAKHKKTDGQVFFLYIFWYGLGRFFIEGLRTDSLMVGSFRISQIVAAVSVIAGGAMSLYYLLKNKNKAG